MAYIGRDTDKISNVEVLDNITFDGSSSYTLQKGGSNFTPSSANTLLLSIDGVVQAGNFTVSGSTIDFGTAVAGTSTCDFVLHYGVGLITTPADGTVSLDKLSATGTKDATTFLRGDNTFAAAGLNGWSEDGANNNLLPASSSAGIYLGVNSATASNLLDDYEEGTWTPTFGNAPSATFNTNGQQGYYRKIGNSVTVGFNISISSLGGASGTANLKGLPFAASNTPTSSRYVGTIGGDDNWSTNLSGNNTILQIYGDYLNTRIFLQKNNCSNKADITLGDIGTSRVLGTITYFTDA
jgi:hypothetical protein